MTSSRRTQLFRSWTWPCIIDSEHTFEQLWAAPFNPIVQRRQLFMWWSAYRTQIETHKWLIDSGPWQASDNSKYLLSIGAALENFDECIS